MATMGTLSGFVTISAKSGSSIDTRDEDRAAGDQHQAPRRFGPEAARG